MSSVYILKNQHQQYLAKNLVDWLDAAESKQFFRTTLHDEALNTLIELTVKDSDLRVTIEETNALDNKKLEIVDLEETKNDQSAETTATDSLMSSQIHESPISSENPATDDPEDRFSSVNNTEDNVVTLFPSEQEDNTPSNKSDN